MDIKKIKRTLNKALNKTDFYTESFVIFNNQKNIPKTFLKYLKMYNREHLINTDKDFEECIKLNNDKILMLSKEQNNFYIFVFYE